MRRTYFCPHCGGRLNPNVKIILRAERRGRKALLLFSPQPGNYDVICPDEFRIKKGDVVEFSCPICGHGLGSRRGEGMAEIRVVNPGGEEGKVYFSRQYGHHETYFVTEEDIRSYGEHSAPDGMNFWGAGPSR